jgi:uncharacterized integral membrane protein
MPDDDVIRERQERRIRMGQTIRVVVALAAVSFLIVFALLNSQDVDIDYAFGEVTAPMIIVIVASAVTGFVLGVAAGWRRSGH